MVDLESLDRMITLTEVAADHVRALTGPDVAAVSGEIAALFAVPEYPVGSIVERRLLAVSGGCRRLAGSVDGAVPLIDAVERLLVALRDADTATRAALDGLLAASADLPTINPARTTIHDLREALRGLYATEMLALMEI